MKRRNFIKTTGMAAAGIGIAANAEGNRFFNFGRKDVEYEDWYGYKLDRKLLNLLQKY